ncbi:MAG: circadian clock protein KaiC [Methanomassiliicoccales archaeon PtaU1.Bin124]|nr:MAG: circadian clock protein KaiC [Methanomassiliicoccales archaeon PtaU1.Bin124]
MAAEKVVEEKRCPSGIEGLDRIVGGGFPNGGVIHIAGSYGSGKTSMAVEFLVRGAKEGQKGILITTTLAPEKVLDSVVRLDIFEDKMIKEKSLKIIDIEEVLEELSHPRRPIDRNGAMELLNEIEEMVSKQGIKRLAIDPITPLLADMEAGSGRDFLKKLGEAMNRRKVTTVITSDCDEKSPLPEVPADGLIRLSNIDRHGNNLRVLQVLKMAGTQHSHSRYVFDITPCGLLTTPLIRGGH